MAEQNPRRRNTRKPANRFWRQYVPIIITVLLSVFCVFMAVLTINTIRDAMNARPTVPPTEQLGSDPTASTQGTAPTDESTIPTESTAPTTPEAVTELLAQAEFQAAGYDYQGAIALLQGYDGYENHPELTDAIARFAEEDKKLVSYKDIDKVTHIFFHSLIVDTDRAFDGDGDANGYNMYMCTVDEFNAVLQQMYDRGFVLVTPYDVAYEVTDENGTHFVYGDIRLPAGKTPFIMSQDDVNYYSYMISSGNGKNETPYFADHANDGFASKIVIGEDGYPTCEYVDKDGNILYGDYDLVPLLERFIQQHPDFAYHGARAVLGVTGYEGVLGYRTKPSYETTMGTADYQKEVEEAKKVVACLKEKGWILASHSYGHPAYGNLTAAEVAEDSNKWETTVQPIIGDCDIILYPHGSDIASWHKYDFSNQKFAALYEDGYRYFFNVDSAVYWTQLTEYCYRGGRRNIDGIRLLRDPHLLSDLFDVAAVTDPARPELKLS